MAYSRYRRYRRRYYKNKSRYYRSKFSRYNTYKNRSAKSQAYQIYSLNKKLNNIEKRTKPEILYARRDAMFTENFRYQDVLQLWNHRILHITGPAGSGTDGQGVNLQNIITGQTCRLQGVKIWGELCRTSTSVVGVGGYVRFLAIQYKNCRQSGISMTDVFSDYDDSTAGAMTTSILTEPLKNHASAVGKILFNKVVTLNNTMVNNYPISLYIPAYKLRTWMNNSTDPVNKGDIDLIVIFGQNSTTTEIKFRLSLSCQVWYTDA